MKAYLIKDLMTKLLAIKLKLSNFEREHGFFLEKFRMTDLGGNWTTP